MTTLRILEYTGLDTSRVQASYRKVTDAIARRDFRAAQVKKLASITHGKFYRARLDEADRLLFALVRCGDEVCALMLEVIANHAYERSRFLRGATIDERLIPDIDAPQATADAQPVRYLHPGRAAIHMLDKPLSFDDVQEEVYRLPPPLIVAGSAGSGKTALILEKLKHIEGEVLYVTHSAYLAQSARDLYYANGFERAGQDAQFLSYREFVESIRVPAGREATWREFTAWFARMRQAYREFDAHQVFEEIRGVITAGAQGALSVDAYRSLGARQSIFPENQRDRLYGLFERYRAWLAESALYDLNLVAHEWQALAAAHYDFVVIDEVQDMTVAQLALVLKTLKHPGRFMMCGDANQIVHPNFFSWAQVRRLFWDDPALAGQQELRVLGTNFRNGTEATRLANQLLKIKQRRFGSIDRESNFLVKAAGTETGQVALVADKDATRRELDQKIRHSTQFAVLVMRDEDKAEARKHFATPLLFSIHEAKGLEYGNIVLYRFVSGARAEFGEITEGVDSAALAGDTLEYRRAKDREDRSLEVYKFFVNALYVAITRALRNVYLIESDTTHPLFALLGLAENAGARIDAQASSREDWQKEARRLELQGKQEQAEAIRRTILRQPPVPWPVLNEEKIRELLVRVFYERAPGNKPRQQLYDYALYREEPHLAHLLAKRSGFSQAKNFKQQLFTPWRKNNTPYSATNFRDILRQCDQYGVDHRLPMNVTPLMAATLAGNVPLVEALLARGADPEAVDHYGYSALHWAMRLAFMDLEFSSGPFIALYACLAPSFIDINTGERLVRLDQRHAEYFLFQTMWVLFRLRFLQRLPKNHVSFSTQTIHDSWRHLPESIVPRERKQRPYLSGVFARNERERDYAYNRSLFMRITQGWYQFNPQLSVRRRYGEQARWVPIFEALNLPLIHEFNDPRHVYSVSNTIVEYLDLAGMPPPPIPITLKRTIEEAEASSSPWPK